MSAVRSKVLMAVLGSRLVYKAGKATFVGEYEIMDSDVDYILLKRLKILAHYNDSINNIIMS